MGNSLAKSHLEETEIILIEYYLVLVREQDWPLLTFWAS